MVGKMLKHPQDHSADPDPVQEQELAVFHRLPTSYRVNMGEFLLESWDSLF